MIRKLLLSVPTTLLLSTAALAQERMRSPDYDGEDAVEVCFDWETDFDYDFCERIPIPGQTGMIGQTYTLLDGSRRTLTSDPRTSVPDLIEEAADTGERSVSDGSRQALASEIDAAAQGRNAAQSGEGPDAVENDTETAAAPAPAKESIVEEEFVLPAVVPFIPGRAEIMPMATGHLNRIETPFTDPMVRTSAEASALNVEFDQNFVYVSVTQPVTLFIHEKGHPDPAIVVSLVPQRIAPRQVRITLPPSIMETVKANTPAPAARNSFVASSTPAAPAAPRPNSAGISRQPAPRAATNTVAHMVQTFAQGRVPQGFAQVPLAGQSAATYCRSGNGLRFSFRQGAMVSSNEYIIVRGMVQASRRVDLDERLCAQHPDTLAVAFSPRTIVGPDQPTDFFVLIRRPNASLQTAREK